jgi:predicted DNA-binding mobile mystery protein A
MSSSIPKSAREHLDTRLTSLRSMQVLDSPSRGWLKAIRNALGMTAEQLAGRLGVRQSTVSGIEQSESSGTISLKTLERAAQAMGCRLVYALVPEVALETTVRRRALEVARRRLAGVNQTIGLEDQALESGALKRQTEQLADYLVEHELSKIWSED